MPFLRKLTAAEPPDPTAPRAALNEEWSNLRERAERRRRRSIKAAREAQRKGDLVVPIAALTEPLPEEPPAWFTRPEGPRIDRGPVRDRDGRLLERLPDGRHVLAGQPSAAEGASATETYETPSGPRTREVLTDGKVGDEQARVAVFDRAAEYAALNGLTLREARELLAEEGTDDGEDFE